MWRAASPWTRLARSTMLADRSNPGSGGGGRCTVGLVETALRATPRDGQTPGGGRGKGVEEVRGREEGAAPGAGGSTSGERAVADRDLGRRTDIEPGRLRRHPYRSRRGTCGSPHRRYASGRRRARSRVARRSHHDARLMLITPATPSTRNSVGRRCGKKRKLHTKVKKTAGGSPATAARRHCSARLASPRRRTTVGRTSANSTTNTASPPNVAAAIVGARLRSGCSRSQWATAPTAGRQRMNVTTRRVMSDQRAQERYGSPVRATRLPTSSGDTLASLVAPTPVDGARAAAADPIPARPVVVLPP